VLLSGGFEANTQNLLQRGALLYCVGLPECGLLRLVEQHFNRCDPDIQSARRIMLLIPER
jgi:hypothetical protein